MKRGLILIVAAALVTISGFSALWAQEDAPEVTSIPFESLAAGSALSPDDRTLALYNNPIIYGSENLETTPEESQIRLLDIQTGEAIGSLQNGLDWVTDVDFNADGSRLIAFHRNGDLSLWDVPNQSLLKTIRTYVYGGGWVLFMPDDQTVLLRLGEFVFGTLDTETSAITQLFGRHIDTYNQFSETYTQFPERGNLIIVAAAVSPDGATIATSTGNDEVLLWDTASGEPRTLRQASEQPSRFAIRTLFLSTDGSELLYFDQTDGQVHRWDVAAEREFQALELPASAFAVAPDEAIVAWADRETSTVTWFIGRTIVQRQFTLPDDLRIAPNITRLFFTSDGKKLVVSGLHAPDEQNAVFVINLSE